MASIFQIDENYDRWRMLDSGIYILDEHLYSKKESIGVMAVSIASMVSVVAILLLLTALAFSLFRSEPSAHQESRHAFIMSHVGIYFICMLISNLVLAVGFMLSIVWSIQEKITFGPFCTIQAALKQFGNVAMAFWVLAIAAHTFAIVFLQMRPKRWVFILTFVGGWIGTALIIASGPLFYQTEELGPWYGISSQWCWTSDSYVMPRFTTEYFWMFLAAAASFILYALLFLKLRGFISPEMRFTLHPQPLGAETSRVAMQMLWYPVVYTILVFPIAGCRIFELRTSTMANFEFKMAAAGAFMLSGLANVLLYTITRNIFPLRSLVPGFLQPKSWRRERDGQQNIATTSFSSEPRKEQESSFYHYPRRTDSISSMGHVQVMPADLEKYPNIAVPEPAVNGIPRSTSLKSNAPSVARNGSNGSRRMLVKKKSLSSSPAFTMVQPIITIQSATTINSILSNVNSPGHSSTLHDHEWSPTQTFAPRYEYGGAYQGMGSAYHGQGQGQRAGSQEGVGWERARTITPEP